MNWRRISMLTMERWPSLTPPPLRSLSCQSKPGHRYVKSVLVLALGLAVCIKAISNLIHASSQDSNVDVYPHLVCDKWTIFRLSHW